MSTSTEAIESSKKQPAAAAVEKFRGQEMDSYLKRYPTVLFRYQVNTNGLIFLVVLAIIAGAIAGYFWITFDEYSFLHLLVLVTFGATTVVLVGLVAYWTNYARLNYLATSDRHLMLGHGSRVIAIRWDALDREKVDFVSDEQGTPRGVVSLQLEGKRYAIKLFNAFAWLENLQGFMAAMLTKMQQLQ